MKILYYTWNLDENSMYYKALNKLKFIVDSTDDEELVLRSLNQGLVDIILFDATTVLNYKKLFVQKRNTASKTFLVAITELTDYFITTEAFSFGLSDYILTSLNSSQVEAKILSLATILNQNKPEKNVTRLSAKDLQLDPLSREAVRDGVVIPLTNKEYKLLELLLMNKNRVLDREEISQAIWNKSKKDYDNNIGDVYITLLRKKIEGPFDGKKIITTIRGVGYVIKD